MWVKAREREKNKEKCINGATFLTDQLTDHVGGCIEQVGLPSVSKATTGKLGYQS
jgi:hypothetical protein